MMSVTQVLAQPHAKKFFIARFISNYGNGMRLLMLVAGNGVENTDADTTLLTS